jgi:hypothetical protein
VHLSSILAVTAFLALPACSDEVVYRHYPTHAGAIAAGEQQRGWLPEWVPSTASDLHLQSDLDSNEWWLRFHLPVSVRDSMKGQLEAADAATIHISRPWRASWWFDGLIQREPANDAALNAQLFRKCCDRLQRNIVLAFDRNTPAVYVWTER